MPELYDNRYQFIRKLGSGGFGSVFLAQEINSYEFVAIKQLKNKDKQKQEDIIYEMQIISRFNNSHIVNYKHNFIQDGLLFIVMEYCKNGSLRGMIGNEKITSTFVWKWMITLTETLQFLHDKEIIHHDIKPDNILFTEDRVLKISDFGVANRDIGTRAYLSPEAFDTQLDTTNDARVDVYALGVTLLELLTGENPFFHKSKNEIFEIHERKEFGITQLDNWQQDIILKAIAPLPEQRFQNMKEFNEAIQAESVPILFDKEVLHAGNLAIKAESFLKRKKWGKAISLLEYAEKNLKPSVNVLQLIGKYYLLLQKIDLAKSYYEKALKWNPRLDVQKELGWINLELKNYPTAISLISDHLHRNPSDLEAYNLLLQCFYETNRYEIAMQLAQTLLDIDGGNKCFANNYYISYVMHFIDEIDTLEDSLKMDKSENYFLIYNHSVVTEKERSHNKIEAPTLKSKLLFMDYRFNRFTIGKFYCTDTNLKDGKTGETEKPIIKIGRSTFSGNDLRVPGGNNISRRHAVIINCKDDVWIYDFKSTGTFVNNERVMGKTPLLGKNIIKIGETEYEMTDDKSKLI